MTTVNQAAALPPKHLTTEEHGQLRTVLYDIQILIARYSRSPESVNEIVKAIEGKAKSARAILEDYPEVEQINLSETV